MQRAIASALAQDADDLEVVVADDGGGTEDIAAGFADPRVRYHRNPRPSGAMANLRFVSALARGEMVVVLDDDDRLLPGFLSTAAEPMRRDETTARSSPAFSVRRAGRGAPTGSGPLPAASRSRCE